MGRNLKDFYGKFDNKNTDFTRSSAQGPEGGASLSHNGNRIVAIADSGNTMASRKVTRNRDVKKTGARLAEVAVGNKPKLRKDS